MKTTKLYESILQLLPIDPIPVKEVVVGVHWTLVCSQYCGLAFTLMNCGPHGHSKIRAVGKLKEKSAQELASRVLSNNLLEASVGMAAINSLITVDENRLV